MNEKFHMNKAAIKQAAIEFKQALIDWKTRWWELPTFLALNKQWTQQEKTDGCVYNAKLIDPVLKTADQILELCITENIDRPFHLSGYVSSNNGRILRDELAFPEITAPYDHLVELLMGGMSDEEFWKSAYYKERLMPSRYLKP